MDVKFRDGQAVVCPEFYTTHGLDHSDITPVISPRDDIVNQVPVLRVRVHQRHHVVV